MVAEKDFNAPKHPELEQVPNLHVIKTMQSLHSKGFVREQFAWRHHYWYLTNEGKFIIFAPPIPKSCKLLSQDLKNAFIDFELSLLVLNIHLNLCAFCEFSEFNCSLKVSKQELSGFNILD